MPDRYSLSISSCLSPSASSRLSGRFSTAASVVLFFFLFRRPAERLTLPLSLALLAFFLLAAQTAQAQFVDDRKATNVGNIRLGITNYGVVGNGFRYFGEGIPSCVYPAGSGTEHLFNGGLWVGTVQNGVTKVTTASNAQSGGNTGGQPTEQNYEFSALSSAGLIARSSLTNSSVFTPLAVSNQDYIATFTDSLRNRPGSNSQISGHNPIGVVVRSEHYAWNYTFTDFFVLVNYTIVNRSTTPMDNTYLGFFTDMIVRNTRVTGTPGGGSFFVTGAGGYLDSVRTMYKFDAAGEPDQTRSYAAIKFLGALVKGDSLLAPPPVITPDVFNVRFNAWEFAGTTLPAPAINSDFERYAKMTEHISATSSIRNTLKTPSNRVEIVTVGPFARLNPGDSVTVAFAVVCASASGSTANYIADSASSKTTLLGNLDFAQRTFNGEDKNGNGILEAGEDPNGNGKLDRYVLPTPPPAPNIRSVVGDRNVTLYWDKFSESAIDGLSGARDFEGYRIYRTNTGAELRGSISTFDSTSSNGLKLISQFDRAGDRVGFDNGFAPIALSAPVKFEGDTTSYFYKYDIPNLLNGWQYAVSVTAFDSGDGTLNPPLAPLESSQLQNLRVAVVGTPAVADGDKSRKVGVYPNPYYVRVAWDSPKERERKLTFYNLPEECEISIYTVAGDVVDRFSHDGKTYNGRDIAWFRTFGNTGQSTQFSGGEHSWDLISKSDQQVASGLYLFSIRNTRTGDVQTGRFAVIR